MRHDPVTLALLVLAALSALIVLVGLLLLWRMEPPKHSQPSPLADAPFPPDGGVSVPDFVPPAWLSRTVF